MKTKGVIRGKTVELETAEDLPGGQAAEVETHLLADPAAGAGNLDLYQYDVVEADDELMQSTAARLGGTRKRSVDCVRADPER